MVTPVVVAVVVLETAMTCHSWLLKNLQFQHQMLVGMQLVSEQIMLGPSNSHKRGSLLKGMMS